MPFKTFTASVLSSSDVNTYLMKQAVITCTSSTRPASPVQGMQIYETDTSLNAEYNGTAWVYKGGWASYTPTLTGFSLGNGVMQARYMQFGKTANVSLGFTAGSTTTYSGNLVISLPLTWANTGSIVAGSGMVDNGTTVSRTQVNPVFASTTTINLVTYNGSTVTNTAPFTFGTSAHIYAQLTYEIA